MRRTWIAILLAGACGGTTAVGDWSGHWMQTGTVPGGGLELMLAHDGSNFGGSAVQHREAGMNSTLTASGTPPQLILTAPDGTMQTYTLALVDADHLTLTSSSTLAFQRLTP